MEQHGGKQVMYSQRAFSMKIGTNKRMWLRQGINTDIRQVSAGHFYLFAIDTPTLGTDSYVGPVSYVYMNYDITLHGQTSNERSLYSEWSFTKSGTSGQSALFLPILGNRKIPYSPIIQPPGGLAISEGYGLTLNGGQTTPCPYYVEVYGFVTNSESTVGATIAINGNAYSTGDDPTYVAVNFTTIGSSATSYFGFVCAVPAGVPPSQYTLMLSCLSAATTNNVWSVWTLPGTFFPLDWGLSGALMHYKAIKLAQQSKQMTSDAVESEEKTDDMVHITESRSPSPVLVAVRRLKKTSTKSDTSNVSG